MAQDVVIEMMSREFPVWRCLHGGSLTAESIEEWEPSGDIPWARFRARNVPLLRKLTDVYGACAVVARDGDRIVGTVRFYPKACFPMVEGGWAVCLQQEPPYGPPYDAADTEFPPLEQLADKALKVHCLMLARHEPAHGGDGRLPSQSESSYRRRGLGSAMVRTLADWARKKGWEAIEATAYEDLELVYATTGVAGRTFWEKLGFSVAEAGVEHAFEDYQAFCRSWSSRAGNAASRKTTSSAATPCAWTCPERRR